MPRLPGLRQAWSQRLVEAADAAETRHATQVSESSAEHPKRAPAVPAALPLGALKRRRPASVTPPPPRRRAQPFNYERWCSSQTDPPGWELTLYALILLDVKVPPTGAETTDGSGDWVMMLPFPEKELGLCGTRDSAARQAAAERLGLLIQTLRHLAVSHAAMLEHHKALLTPWVLSNVIIRCLLAHDNSPS
ncbi:hypothetical protein AB1Y20_002942 [Prymnesium parvum]|uniref:Uncharacterized protein n=1 Tax=Prymnesium parvum TaxID=97485 RepID=A0AB34JA08_PRYPA